MHARLMPLFAFLFSAIFYQSTKLGCSNKCTRYLNKNILFSFDFNNRRIELDSNATKKSIL